ncbi:uncharacterized protein A4U43_C03F29540 [Asparagus officinalis]|uniref:SHSP domain-containing protein n=1 Tax=Asparagus officinalis TaxID=4686 RepID=A0A5P1FJ17_ASPOF|nr:uncharacterized protein A4U43_C03F29540 [Asparagus officinalis]
MNRERRIEGPAMTGVFLVGFAGDAMPKPSLRLPPPPSAASLTSSKVLASSRSPPTPTWRLTRAPTAFKAAAIYDLDEGVGAHAIEIYPGILKVVVRNESGDRRGEEEEEMEMDRWRFWLPSGASPRLATAKRVGGELVVIVPKGTEDEDEEEEGREEFGRKKEVKRSDV